MIMSDFTNTYEPYTRVLKQVEYMCWTKRKLVRHGQTLYQATMQGKGSAINHPVYVQVVAE